MCTLGEVQPVVQLAVDGRTPAWRRASRSASSSESPAARRGPRRSGARPRRPPRSCAATGDPVELAALQRHRPAARVGPRGELGHEPRRQRARSGRRNRTGRGRCAACPSTRGGTPARRAPTPRPAARSPASRPRRWRPRPVRRPRRRAGAAVRGDRVARRRPGRRMRWYCSRRARRGRERDGRRQRAIEQPPARVSQNDSVPRTARPRPARRVQVAMRLERAARVDQGAVQVGRDDARRRRLIAAAVPSAPVAPRVKRGWISPTQL